VDNECKDLLDFDISLCFDGIANIHTSLCEHARVYQRGDGVFLHRTVSNSTILMSVFHASNRILQTLRAKPGSRDAPTSELREDCLRPLKSFSLTPCPGCVDAAVPSRAAISLPPQLGFLLLRLYSTPTPSSIMRRSPRVPDATLPKPCERPTPFRQCRCSHLHPTASRQHENRNM